MQVAGFTLSRHAAERMNDRGLTMAALIDILLNPAITYESSKFPGQMRYVKGDYCVCVDPVRKTIPTLFYNGRLDPKWKG